MKALAAALVEAQKKMPAVERDSRNPHFNSSFTSLDHLIAKTKPVLTEHGLSIVQFPAISETGSPVLRTLLLHTSGEQISADTPLLISKQDMQGFGSAVTYARRYAWASVLGIADEQDDDGNAASTVSAGEPKAQARGASVSQTAERRQAESASPAEETSAQQKNTGQTQFKNPTEKTTRGLPEGHVLAANVKIGFGKNAEKHISDLTPKQLAWYAGESSSDTVKAYAPTDEHGRLVKRAAVAYLADKTASVAIEEEVPFF